jgi:hypothetical protein
MFSYATPWQRYVFYIIVIFVKPHPARVALFCGYFYPKLRRKVCMKSTAITVFKYKGHDVRFAFDEDEAYIFVEDGKKLEHLFIKKDPALVFEPKIAKKIIVREPGKDPKEQWVASIYRGDLFSKCHHYPKTDEWGYFIIWLLGVIRRAHREYVYLRNDNGTKFCDQDFRKEVIDNARSSKLNAENRVEIEQFFIDELSKSPGEEVTFTFIDPKVEYATPILPSGRANAEAAPLGA